MRKLFRLNILITAGPTREPIDPVRFISNRSTGRMGYQIAKVARQRGHKVTLISGPTDLRPPRGVRFISVETARQMKQKVDSCFKPADAVIMAAAVSDYRPLKISRGKIKKKTEFLNLKLIENPDILKGLSGRKGRKILVGFALETENLEKNAKKKLKAKNLDFIVANKCSPMRSPFGKVRTTVTLFDKDGTITKLPAVDKKKVAVEILKRAEERSFPRRRRSQNQIL